MRAPNVENVAIAPTLSYQYLLGSVVTSEATVVVVRASGVVTMVELADVVRPGGVVLSVVVETPWNNQ